MLSVLFVLCLAFDYGWLVNYSAWGTFGENQEGNETNEMEEHEREN